MSQIKLLGPVVAVLLLSFASSRETIAAIIELGDLNIIDDAGNPSNGLRFLEMTFSVGKTQAQALSDAQVAYANARLATPSEFDDLFSAAGISYNGSETASDGFGVGGGFLTFSSGSNYDDGLLREQLGYTFNSVPPATIFFTDPDGSVNADTTFDLLFLSATEARMQQSGATVPWPTIGWLLVSESPAAVPEPSSLMLMSMGAVGLLGYVRRRKRTRSNATT